MREIYKFTQGGKTLYSYDFVVDVYGKRKRVYGNTEEELRQEMEREERERRTPTSDVLALCMLRYVSLVLEDSYKTKIRLKAMIDRHAGFSYITIKDKQDIIDCFEKECENRHAAYKRELAGLINETLITFTGEGIPLQFSEDNKKTILNDRYVSDIKLLSIQKALESKASAVYVALWFMLECPMTYEEACDIKGSHLKDNMVFFRNAQIKIPEVLLPYLSNNPDEPLIKDVGTDYTSIARAYKKMCADCGYDNHRLSKVVKYVMDKRLEFYETLPQKEEKVGYCPRVPDAEPEEVLGFQINNLGEIIVEKNKPSKKDLTSLLRVYSSIDLEDAKKMYFENKEMFSESQRKAIESYLFLIELSALNG